MNSLQTKAILAGLFFGTWPLIMNKSGLNGIASSVIFASCAAIMLLPFSYGMWGNLTGVKWSLVIIAAAIGAVGLLCFNGMLAKATKENVGILFVTMIIVQTAIPAIYDVVMNGGMSPTRGIGFALAFIAAILMTKG